MNLSDYAIHKILCQLTLDNLGEWYLIACFSQQMILAKTYNKIHNAEFLALVEVWKT